MVSLLYLQDGYMNGGQVNMANDVLMELLDEIRCVS